MKQVTLEQATITAVVGAGGTLTFTIEGGGSGYTNPDILVDAPSYSNLEIEGTFRRGIGSTTTTGVNLLMSVELGPNSQSIYADRYADAAALLEDNKTFIAEMAVGRMLDAYPSFSSQLEIRHVLMMLSMLSRQFPIT